jgi:NTE family protein
LLRKTHTTTERPPFERIALILQGGGALGAYQADVYQALAEANLHPDWVAGISIGAVNSALIAGNPPEKRVERDCGNSGKPSAPLRWGRSGSPITRR